MKLAPGRLPHLLILRPWLYQLSQKYGRSITQLRDIPDEEFQTFVDRNLDYVW
jgi:hypothetical protein